MKRLSVKYGDRRLPMVAPITPRGWKAGSTIALTMKGGSKGRKTTVFAIGFLQKWNFPTGFQGKKLEITFPATSTMNKSTMVTQREVEREPHLRFRSEGPTSND